ncbi:MBL fold metallo-hydrolase [Castellaniella caeni]|uniref:MBL fold metallo-hydrolase n=1 Tax=Castellaniella caeni TaxID=266123 RepID=UPI0008317E4F|nr:MBL fold metallo-hydrolase [Castellaniella caeni]
MAKFHVRACLRVKNRFNCIDATAKDVTVPETGSPVPEKSIPCPEGISPAKKKYWESAAGSKILPLFKTISLRTMDDMHLYSIGDAEIIRVTERLADIPATRLFPAHGTELPTSGLPENLTISVHAWVIRLPGRLIIIDTGIGNDRDRNGNPLFDHIHTDFAERLAGLGIDRNSVDTVIMTHLHIDHVGWNTHYDGTDWQPMFPHARYICSAPAIERWKNEPKRRTIYNDSIKPIVDAGLIHPMAGFDPTELGDGLTYTPTPGHSPDHASIILTSRGHHALFGGDIMHHPIQVSLPHWNSVFCEDPGGAENSRRRMLDWCAKNHALYLSSHFAGSSAGYIEQSTGRNYTWRFAAPLTMR